MLAIRRSPVRPGADRRWAALTGEGDLAAGAREGDRGDGALATVQAY
ncbi:hypothetical protein [Actinacidiphila sp. bgisy145]